MDIFDKYAPLLERFQAATSGGKNPFGVCLEDIYSATEAKVDGRRTILLGTNNYLGLTFNEDCIAAATEMLKSHGTGTTGSRIANGSYAEHEALEKSIAEYLNRKSAIVFSTGYQANFGVIVGLAGPKDVIFLDADSHASIYDGCKLSGATLIRFRHNDTEDLDKRMSRFADFEGCKLVVTEGLYSMLGDTAPLKEFVEVKKKHGGWLLVDEAHSFGMYGDHGRGAAEHYGVEKDVDFVAGTFSKSLGAIGGFGASDHPMFDVLRFASRPYMFTASPSPASIASVHAALDCMRKDPSLRTRIWENARHLFQGLKDAGFEVISELSPIVAVRMPDEATAVAFWNRLLENGIYVNLAVPPGTPKGVCLMRCSVSSAHEARQIDDAIDAFVRTRSEVFSDEEVAATAS
ncbi:serine palmitoyltransferase [Limibacillus halophilus]|uniref:8-amino-7-oxononanoate synthase n=1 Tax=Limibacillus halophilus TaxID=1579333 RepID=A0A839T096_9PROT|nr:aminotransferase class I/II-fold pyridoxal phosphate-dependent enzyme [Limibacillus halophilus]MBB3066573.1 8-amino-7-oxononanoate synthase [Limibacillus halophilus]